MINYILSVCALLAGFLTKFVDMEEHGLKLRKIVFYMAAILYGLLIAYAVKTEPVVVILAFGTIIGLVLTKKIDSRAHMLGITSFVIFMVIWGIPEINLVYLFTLIMGSLVDEIVNTQILDKGKIKNFVLRKFIGTRPFMEITAFMLAFFTGLWPLWYTLFFYDLGYILTNSSFVKFVR